MTRIISAGASVLVVALVVAATATHVSAQAAAANKGTFLTFSGTVQVPGATLPAGTYLFRIADPAAQQIWQVFDSKGRHLLAQFFYVHTQERTIAQVNAANGKPVVRFYETPQGTPPAIRVFYHPNDLAGFELLYPEEQARAIAAAAHTQVLATDSDAKKTTLARIMTIQPGTPPSSSAAAPLQTAPLPAHQSARQEPSDQSRPIATSGADEQRPVGTSGRDEAPQPVSSTGTAEPSTLQELPKTASEVPLVAWLGLLALLSGVAIRMSRGRSAF